MNTEINETLRQFDASFGNATSRNDEYIENQKILTWAKNSAARDPEYVKHICERYRQKLNHEKLVRADSICRKAK